MVHNILIALAIFALGIVVGIGLMCLCQIQKMDRRDK